MLIAGYRGTPLFTSAVHWRSLYRNSRGVPRLINILSHKALMSAYGLGDKQITSGHIRRAAADTEDVQSWLTQHFPLAKRTAGNRPLTRVMR